MNKVSQVFYKIFSTIHHNTQKNNEYEFVRDFSGFFLPKDSKLQLFFKKASYYSSLLYNERILSEISIVYKEYSVCLKFNKNVTLKGLNLRQLHFFLNNVPKLKEYHLPEFYFGTLKPYSCIDINLLKPGKNNEVKEEERIEILPLVDFENVCFFIVKKSKMINVSDFLSK